MSETITIPDIDESAFARLDNMLPGADFAVQSDAQAAEAAEQLRAIKSAMKDLDAQRVDAVKPLNNAVAIINDVFRGPLARCKDAETKIKRAIGAWQAEQERQRKAQEEKMRREREAEQARLRAEAEREQAKERERARLAKQKADEAAAKLEAAGKHERAEAARRQAEADRIERERVAAEEAERKRQQAAMAPVAVVAAPPPKLTGISGRKNWKFNVVDFAALPDQYKVADNTKIGKVVRALGDEADIPGIEVYAESSIAARA